MADFGYDIGQPHRRDPDLRDLADADALIARAHALGLLVIVDWGPNHTSDRIRGSTPRARAATTRGSRLTSPSSMASPLRRV
jgi:1,4-alpha-glucan branching enzyme